VLTHHRNSIFNPDVVTDWAKDEPEQVERRLKDDRCLLPNVTRYDRENFPRAMKAVSLWELALTERNHEQAIDYPN